MATQETTVLRIGKEREKEGEKEKDRGREGQTVSNSVPERCALETVADLCRALSLVIDQGKPRFLGHFPHGPVPSGEGRYHFREAPKNVLPLPGPDAPSYTLVHVQVASG